MAVSLPTAADVRKVREQAVKTATERAEAARTPLLAVLGASDVAYTTVTKAVTGARARAGARAEDVQTFVAALPQRFSTEELRKAAADLRGQAGHRYEGFAARGEQAWGRIRTQPRVSHAIAAVEAYTEKLDARVDGFVDDAHDAAEKALAALTRQTRSTGEQVARSAESAAVEAAEAVAEAGDEASGAIIDAGDEAAHAARSTSRRAAARTTPKVAPKPATRKNGASPAS